VKKIFDTSSLVCILKEIAYPEILGLCTRDGYEIIVPQLVYDELEKNPESFAKLSALGSYTIVPVDPACCAQLKKRYAWMGDGEISVFCDGLSREGRGERYYCVLDDNRAKIKGRSLSLRATGTIGLLIWQKQKGAVSQQESEEIHRRFLNSRCYIKSDILDELIR
jgi:predicted nucleic acid-binding protein